MRVCIYILLILLALNMPFFVFLPCALVYALWRPAYELIALGVCVDALFGVGSPGFGYLYTTTLGLLVLCVEVLKPHLTFYNTEQ